LDVFKNFLVTGGEDDKAYFWSFQAVNAADDDNEPAASSSSTAVKVTVELLAESEKFSDSVTCVKFSHDGKYVAVADLAGSLRVYLIDELQQHKAEPHWSHELGVDLETLTWHPQCNVLFAGTANEGQFWMFKLSTGEMKCMYAGDQCSLSSIRLLKDGKHAACAYHNGTVRVWDLKSGKAVHTVSALHEKREIICLDTTQDDLVATGGSGSPLQVNLVNTKSGHLVGTLNCEAGGDNKSVDDSVETLGFSSQQPLILACGTVSGRLMTWDVSTMTPRNRLDDFNHGITRLQWWSPQAAATEILIVSCINGTICVMDGRSLATVHKFTGHTSEILDFGVTNVNISNSNQPCSFLITASNDHKVKFFQIKN